MVDTLCNIFAKPKTSGMVGELQPLGYWAVGNDVSLIEAHTAAEGREYCPLLGDVYSVNVRKTSHVSMEDEERTKLLSKKRTAKRRPALCVQGQGARITRTPPRTSRARAGRRRRPRRKLRTTIHENIELTRLDKETRLKEAAETTEVARSAAIDR